MWESAVGWNRKDRQQNLGQLRGQITGHVNPMLITRMHNALAWHSNPVGDPTEPSQVVMPDVQTSGQMATMFKV